MNHCYIYQIKQIKVTVVEDDEAEKLQSSTIDWTFGDLATRLPL